MARFTIGLAQLEQKIALGHRQHIGGGAGQELAVGADLIGFGIDLDAGRCAVVDHALLGNATRVFETGTSFFSIQSFFPIPALTAALDANTTEVAARARPKAPNIGR